MRKCPGSGQEQMLDWIPDGDYPGAAVCGTCSFGVLVRKGARKATSQAGFEGLAGILRVHYVSNDGESMSYRMRPKSQEH